MKTTLVFLDSKTATKRGFVRGTAVLLFVLVIVAAMYVLASTYVAKYFPRLTIKLCLSIILFSVLFASSISVSHPETAVVAVAYGALVGLVMFGAASVAIFAFNVWPLSVALVNTLFGCLLGSLSAYLLFYFQKR